MLRRIIPAGRRIGPGPLCARRHKALEHDEVIMSEWGGLINTIALVKEGAR